MGGTAEAGFLATRPLDLLARPVDEFVADFVGAGNPLSLFRYLKIRDVPLRTEGLPVVSPSASKEEAIESALGTDGAQIPRG